MNYPVWELGGAGGGLLIAIIGVFHVYVAHFAVGGGLFLVLTELKGYRENNNAIIDYVHGHSKFFLLITLVAGSLSGVGIWFTISLLNPAATSILIHTFVFAWATEWVFFILEITSIFIYYYTFDRLNRRNHLIMGWIYFGSAWMSLFTINGIISFMLTPGTWPADQNFWSGYYNPTFWPALFFRTFLALMIAGLFGFFTAARLKDKQLRASLVRYCATWLLAPFALLLASAWWYRAALPPELEQLIFSAMPEMEPYISWFGGLSLVLILSGLLMALRAPQLLNWGVAALMLLVGLLYIGAFEFIREGGRRPYIIRDYMYSTAIKVQDLPTLRRAGVLSTAKWVRHRRITAENRVDAGREIFGILCLPCHSIGGPLNDIKALTKNYTPRGLAAYLSGMEHVSPYMPPFAGTAPEREALATYIAHGLNGRLDDEPVTLKQLPAVALPAFAGDESYLLVAWSEGGMRALADAPAVFSLSPPGVTLWAQLIKRGETPEVITDQVTLHYEVEAEFGRSGTMSRADKSFTAELVPVVPYPQAGGYRPYPVFTVTARDQENKLLATTKVTVAVPTEAGCRTCHGGSWRVGGVAGLSSETAHNILAAHDRLSKTDLVARHQASGPIRCGECHATGPGSNAAGARPAAMNLSAAIHGFHALFLAGQASAACSFCHPSAETGATRAFRGLHHRAELECTNCHGEMVELALGLLKAEHNVGHNAGHNAGKTQGASPGRKRAGQLLALLEPLAGQNAAAVTARQPYQQMADCLTCHQNFSAPVQDSAVNHWTAAAEHTFGQRFDDSGSLRCPACHGTMHALYPARNPYGEQRDNLQPLQYQKNALPLGANLNCHVCHLVEMVDEVHHPHMLRTFRNQ